MLRFVTFYWKDTNVERLAPFRYALLDTFDTYESAWAFLCRGRPCQVVEFTDRLESYLQEIDRSDPSGAGGLPDKLTSGWSLRQRGNGSSRPGEYRRVLDSLAKRLCKICGRSALEPSSILNDEWQ